SARHSRGGIVLGIRRLTSAPHENPLWEYRQSPPHFKNFMAGQTMVARVFFFFLSLADGPWPGLPPSIRFRVASDSDAHRSRLLVGHVTVDVCARHGSQPVGPRRAHHSTIHCAQAAAGSLWSDRIQLDERGAVLYDQRSSKYPALFRLSEPGR